MKKQTSTTPIQGRLMPQALDAERAVIGACLIEQDAFSRISELLRSDSFYDTKHQIIFGAIKHLNDAGEPVDCLTVTDRLQKNGELGKAGGASYIGELSTSMLSSAHIELHARIVAEKAQRRHIIEHARDITNEAFDEACDVGEILTRSQDELARISGYSAQRYSTLDEVMDEVERIVETNAKSDTLITGMKTGFGYLDERGGLQPGNLIVVGAGSSVGKTSFSLAIAENALQKGARIVFYSMEMTKTQLVARLLSRFSGLQGNRILTAKLSDDDREKLGIAKRELCGQHLLFDDKSSTSFDDIASSIRTLVIKRGVQGAVIDFLQILPINQQRIDREAQLADMARRLKNLANDLGIWIVLLSQLNRDSSKSPIDRLRGSGQINEAADIVLLIDRPGVRGEKFKRPYENLDPNKMALVTIGKGRNIGVGEFIVGFDPVTTFFYDVSQEQLKQTCVKPYNEIAPF